jgi:hypothetical protein
VHGSALVFFILISLVNAVLWCFFFSKEPKHQQVVHGSALTIAVNYRQVTSNYNIDHTTVYKLFKDGSVKSVN